MLIDCKEDKIILLIFSLFHIFDMEEVRYIHWSRGKNGIEMMMT
jgi:hypothetical protein